MTISADEAAATPLTTDEAIAERVQMLIGRAIRRTWWLLFLDDDDRQLPLMMPVDDYPLVPDAVSADGSADFVRSAMEGVGARHVIFVWERPVGAGITGPDRAWASLLADGCRERGLSVRAQLISHRQGVRWLAPDDYAEHSVAS
ncbi:hypothetical protein SAMN04489806_1160 [Paramicrobacterium humi]|uniref:Uncharacterized protein n=1 Tax=Paramicrobacterium humi TaxID=640635 RepID=A0A1H4KGT5_9MICO|nr:hypothetical protein [Microbacterium humi]SEB57613.1 hypothetical protein SAMN04489806_1160 [Microbacterium humi]